MTREELKERLITFAVLVNESCYAHKSNVRVRHIVLQVFRSSTSSALNFGEALAAESRKDFIHKNKIVLKELNENLVGLTIIQRILDDNSRSINKAIRENKELIAIFTSSIQTATNNQMQARTGGKETK